MSSTKGQFVAGFLMDHERERVVLVRKNRPAWQNGFLNGVGGHIEEGETSHAAMQREFFEETGMGVKVWEWYAQVAGPWGFVNFFRAFGPVDSVQTMEDEKIEVHDIDEVLAGDRIIPNLSWLLPLARYTHDLYMPVSAMEVYP